MAPRRPSEDSHSRRVTCVYQDEGLSKAMAQLLLGFRNQCPLNWHLLICGPWLALSKRQFDITIHNQYLWLALNPNWDIFLTPDNFYNSISVLFHIQWTDYFTKYVSKTTDHGVSINASYAKESMLLLHQSLLASMQKMPTSTLFDWHC